MVDLHGQAKANAHLDGILGWLEHFFDTLASVYHDDLSKVSNEVMSNVISVVPQDSTTPAILLRQQDT